MEETSCILKTNHYSDLTSPSRNILWCFTTLLFRIFLLIYNQRPSGCSWNLSYVCYVSTFWGNGLFSGLVFHGLELQPLKQRNPLRVRRRGVVPLPTFDTAASHPPPQHTQAVPFLLGLFLGTPMWFYSPTPPNISLTPGLEKTD